MKQCITRKMWDELSDEEKFKFITTIDSGCSKSFVEETKKKNIELLYIEQWEESCLIDLPTIGQMIEYLGEDLHAMTRLVNGKRLNGWQIHFLIKTTNNNLLAIKKEELTDALWEATKYKLKNN